MSLQASVLPKRRKLVIWDVKTCWNSTHNIYVCALKLRPFIDKWLAEECNNRYPTSLITTTNTTDPIDARDLQRLFLSGTEWGHLELVTYTLEKFKQATTQLSLTHNPNI